MYTSVPTSTLLRSLMATSLRVASLWLTTLAVTSLLYAPAVRAEMTTARLGVPPVGVQAAPSPLDTAPSAFDRLAQASSDIPADQLPAGAPVDGTDAVVAATADAQVYTQTGLWTLAGCVLGVLGIVLAAVVIPAPPASALIGKDADYIILYSQAYSDAARQQQIASSVVGCLIWTGATALVSLLVTLGYSV